MSTKYIKTHSWTKYQEPARAIQKVLRKLDMELRSIDRKMDLYPGEKTARARELRQAAQEAIQAERAKLDAMIAQDRRETVYVDVAGDDAAIRRRSYWLESAKAETAHLDPYAAADLITRLLDAGHDEQAREYLKVANVGTMAGALRQRAESKDSKNHRALAAAVDAVEGYVVWLDKNVESALSVAGHVSEVEKAGGLPQDYDADRGVGLWADTVGERGNKAAVAAVTMKTTSAPVGTGGETAAEGGAE